jgi:ABC-type nitrate/sulfonate/bicarbonate transport system permease component
VKGEAPVNETRRRLVRTVVRLAVVAAALGAWQLYANRAGNPYLLPPSVVFPA